MRDGWVIGLFLSSVALATVVSAQHADHQHGRPHHASPYSEFAARPIKALSAEQIDDLKSGRGMGLSLPAELNGYPGPKHVLELADQLGLDNGQKETTRKLIATMSREAVAVGFDLIDLEQKLEGQFVDQSATPSDIELMVGRIGIAQAKLRYAHLKTHLAMKAALTDEQAARYVALRGYSSKR